MINTGDIVSDTLRWLSQGPRPFVYKHSGYDINGFHFLTRERDSNRVTQNSGVTLVAEAMQVATAKDKNPITSDMMFYGVIEEIWDLDYHVFRIPVMKCDWVKNKGGVKKDRLGFTLVDLKRLGHKSDPFILASQAKQVFFVTDPSDVKWSVVCHMPNRGFSNQINKDEVDNVMEVPAIIQEIPSTSLLNAANGDNVVYARDSNEGIWIAT